MRNTYFALAVISLAALIGCNQTDPGGPGVTKVDTQKPVVGQADETFSLTMPALTTSLQQGESKDVSIFITRGKDFAEDVDLTFGDMPKGVTLTPETGTLKASESEAKFTLKAADDAALGDFTIKVNGHPVKGADTSGEFKVSVTEKEKADTEKKDETEGKPEEKKPEDKPEEKTDAEKK